MRKFWGYLKVIVVTMHLALCLDVQIDLSISVTYSLAAELFTDTFPIISYMVLSNSVSMSTVCTIMPLLENIFINLFNYLLNCLAVHIGTCLDVTNFVPRDMVINNGALFTNIKSDKKLQTYVI